MISSEKELYIQWRPVINYLIEMYYCKNTEYKNMYEALKNYKCKAIPDHYPSVVDVTDDWFIFDKGSEGGFLQYKYYLDDIVHFRWGVVDERNEDDGQYHFTTDMVICPNGKILKFD